MPTQPLRIGFAGCGDIAGKYAKSLQPYDQIELVGAAALRPERARAFAATYGGKGYASLDDMLADDRIDLVVDLTLDAAHPTVIRQCLNAGKHVYSEKPLALNYTQAKALVDLAEARERRLACAPIIYMGEAQQTAWRLIRTRQLGPIRVVYCDLNLGRIESWHPNPVPFYEIGPLINVGVYPLTLLTTIFGPARRVTAAFGQILYPDRVSQEGIPFQIDTPDWFVAALELANGTVVRLTTNFYIDNRQSKQNGLEFHGDSGSLYLGHFQNFHAPIEFANVGEAYAPVPYLKEPYEGVDWGRGLVEMVEAMAENRPQRATGAQAAHVVEILEAINRAYREGRPVAITSDFTPPQPMEWAA